MYMQSGLARPVVGTTGDPWAGITYATSGWLPAD